MKNNHSITRCGALGLLAAILTVSITTAVLGAGDQPTGCICIHADDWDADIPEQGRGILFGAPECVPVVDSLACYFNWANMIELEWQCPGQGTSGTMEVPDCQTDDGNACGAFINE